MSASFETANEKYFAYYIPENKLVLMQDIRDAVLRTYGTDVGRKLANQIQCNLQANDWDNVIGDNITIHLNSLVLVKITDVSELFINAEATGNASVDDNFVNLKYSNVPFKNKINNGDNSIYKQPYPTFSGTQDLSYVQELDSNKCDGTVVLPKLNYIFIETITISLKKIFNSFIEPYIGDYITIFDAKNQTTHTHEKTKKFDDYITEILQKNSDVANNIDEFPNGMYATCIDLLKLLNGIVNGVDTREGITWDIMRNFIPLVDSTYNQLIIDLWKRIMKDYDNPTGFLNHHMLIVNDRVGMIRDICKNTANTTGDNLGNNEYSIESKLKSLEFDLNAKLYITDKSFSELCVYDALPYRMHFLSGETTITPYDQRHNNIANRINTIEDIISNIRKQLLNDKLTEVKKQKFNQDIAKFDADIVELLGKLTPINPILWGGKGGGWGNHILHRTMIGVRCMFNDYLNGFKVLTYLRPILMNASRLKHIFRFKYEVSKFKMNDVFTLFIHKDYLEQILNPNIKEIATSQANTNKFRLDLFTTCRLFKFKMEERFDDSNYNISDYRYNSINTIDDTLESVKKLNVFLQENLAVELIRHQKSNVLWMVALEDKIDYGTLVAKSIKTELARASNHRDDISYYISSFKSRIPESFIKNYVIDFNKKRYLLDINKNATIAQTMSIVSFLNYENIRSYGSSLRCHYSLYDCDVIQDINTIEDFRKTKAIKVPLCGGALCDEVGLGKTLSIISTLIVKMKHDMMKYSYYKSGLSDLLCQLDENISRNYTDPLDAGFEYNNLIVVPSRLTSQWETEITKYCADKYNLRVKVLVSISSIRQLEKELQDFYEKLASGKVANADEYRTGGKKKASNQQHQRMNANIYTDIQVSQEPIIKMDKFTEIDIPIIENIDITSTSISTVPIDDNTILETTKQPKKPASKAKAKTEKTDTMTEVSIKLTKEQKMIQKLMANAKKKQENVKTSRKKVNDIDKVNSESNSSKTGAGGVSLDTILQSQMQKNPMVINNRMLNKKDSSRETNVMQCNDAPKDAPKDVPKDAPKDSTRPDNYQYIMPYLESNETGEDYHRDQLYDIYIVSINLLSNENYLDYICHNEDNHLKPFTDSSNDSGNLKIHMAEKILEDISGARKICRITNKFNIFKIKWNRVILDEAHEKLNPIIKYFSSSMKQFTGAGRHKYNYDDQFLFENLVALKANYKWALTGTPSQSGVDNIMGILQFITKYDVYDFRKIEKIRYFSDLLGMSSGELDTCLLEIFKKTLKKEVKNILNIPLFTEEIIYVDQTNIERNIYNTIRASRHFTDAVKIRRLFLMCTNILINEGYDFDGNNDIQTSTASDEPITLEQLNANMIGSFTKQLGNITAQETQLKNTIELLTKRMEQWRAIVEYVQTQGIDAKIAGAVLDELQAYFGNIEKPSIRMNVDLIYRLLDAFSAYKDAESAGMVLYMNYESIKQELKRGWKPTWETEAAMTWLAGQGSQLGVIKSNDEIRRNNNKIQGMQADKTRINNQIALFSNNEFLKDKTSDPCIICFEDLRDIVLTPCRHIFCLECAKRLSNNLKANFTCPECRTPQTCEKLNITTVNIINSGLQPAALHNALHNVNDNLALGGGEGKVDNDKSNAMVDVRDMNKKLNKLEAKYGEDWKLKCTNKYGSKMTQLVDYLHGLFDASAQNRVIIFSQYDKMLKMIGKTFNEYGVNYVYCHGNNFVLNKNIQKFKKDDSIRVIMLSSETSNSGSNLTEANYIIFIDVLYNDTEHVKATEAQAIGRAVRLGQKLPVKVVRFITRGTIEDEHFQRHRYDMNTLQE